MAYVNDSERLRLQANVIHRIHEAFIHSNGVLRITLASGKPVEGQYYGAQCSASSSKKLSCSVTLGAEDGEYPGVYDVLEIVSVEPATHKRWRA
jgi:hypothetical protein